VNRVRLVSEGEAREVRLEGDVAWIDGRRIPFRAVRRGNDLVALQTDEGLLPLRVARDGGRVFVARAGRVFDVRSEPVRAAARPARTTAEHGGGLTAPMPGTVIAVRVKEGDDVDAGQVLIVLEAMKMENTVAAPGPGRVARVLVQAGQQVQRSEALVDLT